MCFNTIVYKVHSIMLLLATTTLSHIIAYITNAQIVLYVQYAEL